MSIDIVKSGELLHFYPEEITILVLMVNERGIRYIEPMNMTFDEQGNIETKFTTYEALSEWTISLGTVKDISETLTGK
jgi:hypothetical protein